MEFSGSFVFVISDEKINFEDIKKNIDINPTEIIKKGQLITKNPITKNSIAPYDIWSYEIQIQNEQESFLDLSNLLEQLLPYRKYIRKISEKYNQVAIECFLVSDMGQIGFEITTDMVSKLNILGISINFHILSYGLVEK